MKQYFLYYEANVVTIDPSLERRVLAHTDEMMMVEISAKSSAVLKAHQHFHTQMTYIIDGVFEFEIESEKRILKKGDSIFIESNKVHGAICLEEGKLLDVFTPARKDLL